MLNSTTEIAHFFAGGIIVGLVMLWLWTGEQR